MIPTPRKALRSARCGLLAAAAALLMQIFAWGAMPFLSVSVAGTATEIMVICTSEGLKPVVLDEDGLSTETPSEKPPTAKAGGHCPLCSPVNGLGMPPVRWLILPADVKAHEPITLPGARIATGWFLATLQARGPPLQG
jgi:hypothetical protein